MGEARDRALIQCNACSYYCKYVMVEMGEARDRALILFQKLTHTFLFLA